MQEPFKEFYKRNLRAKAKNVMFWFNHIFLFIGIQFVGFMGGPSEAELSLPIQISLAILYPIVALMYETYKIYKLYKKSEA